MATICDYVNWRGDLTFQESPFNEVDAAILAYITYVDMEHIVPSVWEEGCMKLGDVSARYWESQDDEVELARISLIKNAPFVLRRIADTKRFQDVRIGRFESMICPKEYSQFGAAVMELAEQEYFIAFRGTDDSVIGWEENLRMCYEQVPAQAKAVQYLDYIGRQYAGKLWIGGHSKGGHLATYAAINSKPELQQRMQRIYNFDGPGITESMLHTKRYSRVQDKILKYVPEESVVGMLLEQGEGYRVVSSHAKGIRQHDVTNWRVLRDGFVQVPKRDEESAVIDQTIRDWIETMNVDQRRELVQQVFDSIEQAHVTCLSDFVDTNCQRVLMKEQKKLRNNPHIKQLFRSFHGHIPNLLVKRLGLF